MSSPPRADAERFAIRPRDVPELADRDVGPRFLHEARQQREVIVLHEHHRAVVADLLDHRVGEPAIDPHVLLPVRIVELRPRIGDVAQRPQARCSRSRSSSPALLPASARRAAACTTADRAARATRPRASAVSRSALPLPCAIHVPPQARITGSSAVTRPLAGRVHSMPSVSLRPRSQFHSPRACAGAGRGCTARGSRRRSAACRAANRSASIPAEPHVITLSDLTLWRPAISRNDRRRRYRRACEWLRLAAGRRARRCPRSIARNASSSVMSSPM